MTLDVEEVADRDGRAKRPDHPADQYDHDVRREHFPTGHAHGAEGVAGVVVATGMIGQELQDVHRSRGDGGSEQALNESLGHEGHPDEPVGRPDQLHHRDLASTGEDGHADGVQDQDSGRYDEHHRNAEEYPL
jgi:hypothetical protein